MSIASEFDSTIENIKSDYEGLENIGADLTNIDKNIYNIRTCLDNIYDSLPKTTGEGSNLSLTTLKGRINVDDILGDTQQDTTNGYQLIDPSTIETGTKNGITLSQTNGIITISGTATGYTPFNINVGEITGDKYLSCDNWGSFTIYTQYNGSGVGNVVQNTTFSASIDKLVIGITSGTTINKTIKLMLETGTTAHSYEPYTNGASPNPTYPQDINVVTGTQEVVVQNKNLANVNETQMGKAWNNASNSARAILVLPIEHNTQYTISYGSLGSIEGIYYGYRTDETTAGGGVTQMSANPTTITTNDTNNYIIFQFNKTSISLADIQALNLQLEKGSTKTDFVEHQEQTKTLHLGDIELAKIGTYQDRIFETSGKNYIDEATEITQGGTVAPNDTTRVSIRVKKQLKANTTYTFVTNLPVPSFAYAFVLGTKVSPWSSSQQIYDSGWKTTAQYFTYTTTQDCYVNIPIRNSTGTAITPSDISKYWFMIYEGAYDSNILYEPYGSDKWYIEKNIGKYILESTKNWQYISVTQGSLFRSNNSISNAIIDNSYAPYCNYYTGIPLSQTRANNNIIINNSSTYTYIDIVDNRYTSADTFKTWLASHNVELLYVLATPTYTEITNTTLLNELNELEKMMSYNGQTNISVSGNLPMILDVSALKGE